jgi:Eukaryotic and archaeal DNA primase, large subunit
MAIRVVSLKRRRAHVAISVPVPVSSAWDARLYARGNAPLANVSLVAAEAAIASRLRLHLPGVAHADRLTDAFAFHVLPLALFTGTDSHVARRAMQVRLEALEAAIFCHRLAAAAADGLPALAAAYGIGAAVCVDVSVLGALAIVDTDAKRTTVVYAAPFDMAPSVVSRRGGWLRGGVLYVHDGADVADLLRDAHQLRVRGMYDHLRETAGDMARFEAACVADERVDRLARATRALFVRTGAPPKPLALSSAVPPCPLARALSALPRCMADGWRRLEADGHVGYHAAMPMVAFFRAIGVSATELQDRWLSTARGRGRDATGLSRDAHRIADVYRKQVFMPFKCNTIRAGNSKLACYGAEVEVEDAWLACASECGGGGNVRQRPVRWGMIAAHRMLAMRNVSVY